MKRWSTTLSPATVEVVARWLSAILGAAMRDGVIAHSPYRDIRLPRSEPALVEPLPIDRVSALIDAVPERYRALVVAAAGTGLRQGEAFGLTAPRVDFLRRQLRVEQQLVLVPGREPHLTSPKTAASRRVVPLPDVVVDALAAHLAEYGEGPEHLVFTAPDGGPIRRNRFSEAWRAAVAAAGLPQSTHFHELRHFYASLLIRHGESVKVVQARLGHASASETLGTYAHLWPDSEDRTRAAVDSVFERPADFSRTSEASAK